MADPADNQLLGLGAVVDATGVPRSTLRFWASRGLIPAPIRIQPGDRRVWRAEDLPTIERRVASLVRGNGRRRTAA